MDLLRRQFLMDGAKAAALAALVGTGLLRPTRVLAAEWNNAAFDAKTLPEALKGVGSGATPKESKDIQLKAPEIAENGAVVPLEIVSGIPNTHEIMVFVDKNPQPLAASFAFSAAAEPRMTVRVKMGQTSIVRAIVKTEDGQFYQVSREVKVTIGGCGG